MFNPNLRHYSFDEYKRLDKRDNEIKASIMRKIEYIAEIKNYLSDMYKDSQYQIFCVRLSVIHKKSVSKQEYLFEKDSSNKFHLIDNKFKEDYKGSLVYHECGYTINY